MPDEATGEEREAIEEAIAAARFRPAAIGDRHLLLPALNAVQARTGHVSRGALNAICRRLGVPPAEAYGVASFYALLSLAPRPPRLVHVCEDLACRAAGGVDLLRRGRQRKDPDTLWQASPCLGLCERAPAAFVQVAGRRPVERAFGPVSDLAMPGAVDGHEPGTDTVAAPQTRAPRDPSLRLLGRVGLVDPEALASYRAHGGFEALQRAIRIGPDRVIQEVQASGLLGRGGAAFPTGRKWEAVAQAPVTPHYLVCNADESEPGTFKDRVLMEEDPFAIVEAMAIAAIATGCDQGFIYVRGEYARAARRIEGAARQAREAGLIGDRVAGSDRRFDLEIRRGAGAYICGEETALFNSIEGFRGEPRNKPPFPTEVGLFGKPTLINNVETLVNVIDIVNEGGASFAAVGTKGSSGTRLFCLSGSVVRPGLYEVPFGTTLRALIDRAGGVPEGRAIRTVLLGGAAGSFLPPDAIDLKLTFEDARAAGATLGSGAVVVLDDRIDLADMVLRIAAFFRDESCGQCVPCRIGTVRQEEALHRIARGGDGRAAAEVALIGDVGRAMRDASICGLGQTAASAVLSALERIRPFDGKEVP